MLGDETLKALNNFGERVKIDSKVNLKRKNKVASSRLINSIDYNAKVSKNSFELSFEITGDEFDDTQNLEKIYSHDETAQKSLMGQLCHLTHKIREKLNG